ncbi:hypothetical protein J4052_23275 [Bacillus toyonensis]|nr:hypothetical protein [Bacillus toyonensis]
MSIKKIQITRRVEEIIKGYLFRGRYPTFETITHQFAQWLREHRPGTPSFNPVKVFRKEKSDADKYNNHVSQIHQDITDAYDATINQTTQIMTDFNLIETERNKLSHELANISKSIDELLLVSNNSDYKYFESYVVSFENASDVNKANSTIFVDIQNKEVTLSENIGKGKRIIIDPNKAYFQTLQPSQKNEALESITHAFDDNINTAWWHVVKTKELSVSNVMRAELTVMFDEVEELNYIEYIPHHGKPINIKLEYTNDGAAFSPIYQQAQTDKITGIKIWSFQKINAQGVKFVFEKSDYDERSGDFYNYYFGAKTIGMYKKDYLSEGVLYTNPIPFKDTIQQVSIMTKEDVPFNTELKYEIALHDPAKSLEELIWHPVSSSDDTQPKFAKVVTLNTKETKQIETSKCEPTREVINGMQVFRLMKDNGDGIISEQILNTQTGSTQETFDELENPKLFRGINQWKRERTYIPFNGQIPLNSIWDQQYQNRPEIIRVDYIPKGNILSLRRDGGGFDDNFYRYSICVFADESRNEPLSLSVMSMLGTGSRKRLGSYSVYVNRQRLAPVNDEVTMKFEKGWNEIQILYHWGDMQDRVDTRREELPLETIIGKFNFAKEKRVRGDLESMQFVESHTLFHNISPNNRSYFAIHERQVILNYLPKNCIFQLIYETNKNIEKHNEMILRANLRRDANVPYVTPKIYSIQLRAK